MATTEHAVAEGLSFALTDEQRALLYRVAPTVLAAARRILHNGFSASMPPVRSLYYFQGVIQEVLERPPGYREISLLREQLAARHSRY